MADNAAEISGAERAAILLMSLGEQDAAAVIRHMDAREVQRVGQAMAALKNVPRERIQAVLGNFVNLVETQGTGGGSGDFVKRVLTSSLGKQRAGMLLERIQSGAEAGAGMEQLKWMHPKQVAQLISGEHPQVIATALAQLDAEQAGNVAALLPEEIRADVLIRVATLDEVPQGAISDLDALVESRAAEGTSSPPRRLGGSRLAADMLNNMDREMQGRIMGKIGEANPDLNQVIKDLLFVFDNLLQVDDKGIQALLREVQSDVLGTAMRGADPEVQEKIFRNMSKRAAEILKDDMEVRGPVKLSEVEAAQKEIVTVAMRLADEGTIVLGGGSADYV